MRDRLTRLLAENRGPFTPMAARIVAATADAEPTVYLYDPIVGDRATAEWWGGVCPQDFVPALRALKADRITLRVNCPGGDVFAAEPMCQALREHPAHITCIIEGLAASAATLVTSACAEVLITPASQYMVHEAWTMMMGNKRDYRAMADLLQQTDDNIEAEYARRTGKTPAEVRAWVEAETWFRAQAAVDAGFCDGVLDTAASKTAKAQAQARTWRLSAYERAPVPVIPGVDEPAAPAPAAPAAQAPAPAPAPAPAAGPDPHRERQRQRARLLTLHPIE
jgi:ATP-dependent Clp protease protease subunit